MIIGYNRIKKKWTLEIYIPEWLALFLIPKILRKRYKDYNKK